MPGVILAYLDRQAAATVLLRAAAGLADLVGGAAVHALIVRTPPEAAVGCNTARRRIWHRRQRACRSAACGDNRRRPARPVLMGLMVSKKSSQNMILQTSTK
jgi:hypothetical protein